MTSVRKDRVLIVEGEPRVASLVRELFRRKGWETLTANNCAEAEKVWESVIPDLTILDCSLPDGAAVALLARLRTINAAVPFLILAERDSADVAVQAIKSGAEQFLTKPINLTLFWLLVQQTLENNRNFRLKVTEQVRRKQTFIDPFVGKSDEIQKLKMFAGEVAGAEYPVVIVGEGGTGKEALARWIHQNGPRFAEPLVHISCAQLSQESLENETFGIERGANSDALETKMGLLEIAHKGAVLLDEIRSLDARVKSKLLYALVKKQFRRLGDVRDRRVDVRLLATTRQNTKDAPHENKLRDDLLLGIKSTQVLMSPLRNRIEDIPMLAERILENLALTEGRRSIELTSKALRALEAYSWPGNIRELRNVLERAVLISGGSHLTEADLHFEVRNNVDIVPTRFNSLHEVERKYIERILALERGRVESAAKKLGMPRSSLYYKIKHYQINPAAMRMPR